MTETLSVTIEDWTDGKPIPVPNAFCAPDPNHATMGGNRSPAISWSAGPEGTESYAIICHDPDVPSVGDNVNQEDKTVSADLPRVDFYHWVLVDIPATVTSLAGGADSDGITPKGKEPGVTPNGVRGINDYTAWFEGDPDMGGKYGGYDGPCPPWNDELLHRYIFTVYALDIPSLGMRNVFGGKEALEAMKGHILAKGEYAGTYTLNPDVG